MLELVNIIWQYNLLFLHYKYKDSCNKTESFLLTNPYFFYRRRREVQKDENEVT